MTTARRKRKPYWAAIAACAGLAAYAGLVSMLSAGPPTDERLRTEQLVVDWHTGLAINGYDPVASSPTASLWLATAISNCPTAARSGVSPMSAIARHFRRGPTSTCRDMAVTIRSALCSGVAVAGNPNVWLLIGEKLFLFYDADRRDKFAADPDRFTASANRKWPSIVRTLIP